MQRINTEEQSLVAFVPYVDLFQRLAEAEQHIVELRSRILGLTALNAELTRKLKEEVSETTVLKALEARNAELQEQLTAANKEISGVQVCFRRLLQNNFSATMSTACLLSSPCNFLL